MKLINTTFGKFEPYLSYHTNTDKEISATRLEYYHSRFDEANSKNLLSNNLQELVDSIKYHKNKHMDFFIKDESNGAAWKVNIHKRMKKLMFSS